ncbi:GTP cyclohydrolase I FolE [Candidatus Magnetobacterium casense]|uniref:GTP cyclohydrolase 1 n=1 Tax=Candidatus Magnetobacterium casense TaxID=1455061 RepID=A0ABS6RYU0_9BACT|nr:GTP cyclohydrolase I FolE [Candidatus Magnetobacterium casensis]MBV6341817.1 GTP cyclohydrolase I FolE [Candidatus Magnetobacterium casensis]
MDIEKIKRGVELILEGIGEHPQRPGLQRTPHRVAAMYKEILSGMATPGEELLKPIDGENYDEMVILKDITFYSMCEHHMLPFFGTANIAYIPDGGKIVGIGELAKALDLMAKRLQVQERLTTQLADLIMDSLRPKGTMVVIEAEHLCLSMRGLKKQGAKVVTSAVRGIFRTRKSTRDEILSLIRQS